MRLRSRLLSVTAFSVSTAMMAMQTLASTRLILGVRNLLYRGRWLNIHSFNGMKFLPHDIRMASSVAINSHHRAGPLTTRQPSTKRNTMMAPK